MIKLIDVHFSFGARPILDGVSWMLGDRDRTGLMGENGSGKSTLIKVMAGVEEFDRGRLEVSRKLRIGYLPQQGLTHQGRTLEEEVREAVQPILALKEEHDALERQLGRGSLPHDEQEALLHRMAELSDQFELQGGFQLTAKMGKVLAGLGFREEDRSRPVETFSGGWQMRIALAKLLLSEPQALLLDEPTNHLDLDARNWLETYLQDFPGAYLIVSHDRYFLDVTAEKIVEIEDGRLTDYKGNYSHYLVEKEKRVEAAETAYERQQEEIQRLNAFINKYKADKKRAGQVGSRTKMRDKIVPLEPPRYQKPIRFHFPPAPGCPQEMVRLSAVAKSYDGRPVLDHTDLKLFRGEKVAVVGPNGSGKSTLLGILADRKKFESGSRKENERVAIAFFGQDAGEELEPGDTVMEAVSRGAPFDMYPRLRGLLGAFLFHGDDIDKKVGALSGGEKSRLALARLLLKPANLLLLDEPTNHLDLRAKEVLMDAFQSFQGTLVFVAHDRYFLETLPDRILEVADGKVTNYIGNYSDYLWAREKQERTAAGLAESLPGRLPPAKAKAGPAPSTPETAHRNDHPGPSDLSPDKQERLKRREEDKARQKTMQKIRRRQAQLEEAITKTEEDLKKIDARMTDPQVVSNYVKLMGLEGERKMTATKLSLLIEEWEALGS